MKPISSIPSSDIAAARRLICGANRVAVLTGAGVSTDSGIPDFRGPDGVWTRDPKAEKASHITTYVNDDAHRRRNWQKLAVGSIWIGKEPNAGHRALVDIEAAGRLHTLVTQNVDGLHLAAGTTADRLVEIHGTATRVKCLDCGDQAPMERAIERVKAGEVDPSCRSCGGLLKSATISFGQSLISEDLERAEVAAQQADVMLCVGTSLAVYPIAHMVPTAHRHGAAVVIVNGEPTQFDGIATHVFHTSISDLLPQLVAGITPVGAGEAGDLGQEV